MRFITKNDETPYIIIRLTAYFCVSVWQINSVDAFHSAMCPSAGCAIYNSLFIDMWHKLWHKTHGKGAEKLVYDSF